MTILCSMITLWVSDVEAGMNPARKCHAGVQKARP